MSFLLQYSKVIQYEVVTGYLTMHHNITGKQAVYDPRSHCWHFFVNSLQVMSSHFSCCTFFFQGFSDDILYVDKF